MRVAFGALVFQGRLTCEEEEEEEEKARLLTHDGFGQILGLDGTHRVRFNIAAQLIATLAMFCNGPSN